MKTAILASAGVALLVVAGVEVRLIARQGGDERPTTNKTSENQQPAQDVGAAAKAAMRDAAKKAYEAFNAGHDVGTTLTPEVYVWSRRWAEAERALAKTKKEESAALLGHWRRMGDLHAKIEALFRAGANGGERDRYFPAKYYLAEAELMLAEAGVPQGDRAE